MIQVRTGFLSILICLCVTLGVSSAFAGSSPELKFRSSRNLAVDAQTIRVKALDMGWTVNKPYSFIAASVIIGKTWIYPKSEVEVSLRESDGQLQVRAQALSKDAGTAYWHNIYGDRLKEKTNQKKGNEK
jgi:hypothetical protein